MWVSSGISKLKMIRIIRYVFFLKKKNENLNDGEYPNDLNNIIVMYEST